MDNPKDSGLDGTSETRSTSTTVSSPPTSTSSSTATTTTSTTSTTPVVFADVEAVLVTGEEGDYTFSVTLRSGDEGCEAYADWWEVLSSDGTLLYRRILNHSHVEEQPFTRSGGPISVVASDVVLVRAHRHPTGYGGQAMEGRPDGSFVAVELPSNFAAELETTEPLPEDCWY